MTKPEVVKLNSGRELEQELNKMASQLAGKETEGNWEQRDKLFLRLRGMLLGGIHEQYEEIFLTGIRKMMNNIIYSMSSLRTSLVLSELALVADLATYLKTSLDSFLEALLNNLFKAAASTKKLISQAATHTTDVLLRNTSYHIRTLNIISLALSEKNAQLRSIAAGYLKTILETHGDSRYDAIMRTGGLEVIEQCLRKGVADANPGTREGSREAYRLFWELWQDRAQIILNSVDATTKKQLIRHLGKLYTASTQGITVSSRPIRPSSRTSGRGSSLGKHITSTEDTASNSNGPRPPSRGTRGTRSVTPSSSSRIISPPTSPRRPSSSISNASSSDGRAASPITSRRMQSNRNVAASPPPAARHRQLSESPPLTRPVATTRSSSPGSSSIRPMSPGAVGPRSHSVASQRAGITTSRRPASSLGHRRLPLVDQLKHNDWRVRIEGLTEMTHMIQARGSSYEALVDAKALPGPTVLGPVLLSLFTDANSEVVKSVTQPEVIGVVTQIVHMEQIITRIISIEGATDVSSSGRPTAMRRLKDNLSDYYIAPVLCKCLVAGGGGPGAKKTGSSGPMGAAGRRKVVAGVVAWMKEITERVIDESNGEIGHDARCYFAEMTNFKLYLTRLFPLLSTTPQKSPTYVTLVEILMDLREVNHVLFEQVLETFDQAVVSCVEEAVGIYHEEDDMDAAGLDEDYRDTEHGNDDGYSFADETSEQSFLENANQVDSITTALQNASVSTSYDDPTSSQVTSSTLGSNAHKSLEKNSTASATVHSNGGTHLSNGHAVGNTTTSTTTYQSVSVSVASGPAEKKEILEQGVALIRSGDVDSLGFRKLIRLAKETAPEIDAELTEEVWGSGGERLTELILQCIAYLEKEQDAARKEYCLLLVKQLLLCQTSFLGDEARLLLRQLMANRSDESNAVCSAAEDALDSFVTLIDRQLCLQAILEVLEGCAAHLAKAGDDSDKGENDFSSLFGLRSNPLSAGFTILAKLLRRHRSDSLEDGDIAKIVSLATEGMRNNLPEVRKSAVDLLVALHTILGENLDNHLVHLALPQRKLIAVYINRSQKSR